MRLRAMAATMLLAGVLVAGCGGDDGNDGDSGEERAEQTQAETTEAPPANAESLWITAADSGNVYRVNPTTGAVDATIKVGEYPADVAVGHGSVWVANAQSGDVSRINPETNEVAATLDTDDARGLAISDDAVWVSRISTDPAGVIPIDPESSQLGEPIATEGDLQPDSLAWADGTLFADEGYSGGVLRFDVEAGEVEHVDLDQVITDIEVHEGSVYAAGIESVIQVDAERLRVTEEFEEDDRPWALAPDPANDSFFVAFQAPTVKTLDLGTGRFSAAKGDLETTGQPYDVVLAEGYAWVIDDTGKLHQVDPQSLAVKKTFQLPGASGPASIAFG